MLGYVAQKVMDTHMYGYTNIVHNIFKEFDFLQGTMKKVHIKKDLFKLTKSIDQGLKMKSCIDVLLSF